jgi:hypothetical protein
MAEHENGNHQAAGNTEANGADKARKRCCPPEWHRMHGGESGEWGWWKERTLTQKIVMGIGFGILGLALAFLFGLLVMLLWNWLMPDIFGLKRLTYWQAWGLLILFHILFKGCGSRGMNGRSDRKRRRHLRRYMREEPADAEHPRESE